MRTFSEITRDRQAAADKRTAIGGQVRAITERLHAENRTADAGEAENLARLERGYQKAQAEEDRLNDEARDLLVETAKDPRNTRSGDYGAQREREQGPAPTGSPDRDRAHRAIDALERSGQLPDYAATSAERLITTGSPMERDIAAQWAAATGDPAYLSAFRKALSDPLRGHLLWDAREQAAYQAVAAVQRNMSLTVADGGYMVPTVLDPAILLTGPGSISPMRRISRVVTTIGSSWNGVSSAGVTAEWLAEADEAADASPTLAPISIPVFKGSAFVPYSFELGMDAPNFVAELQALLVDGADQLQAEAFATGAGTIEPTGLVTALTGGASEFPAAGEALLATDVLALQADLPPRWQNRAQWGAALGIINVLAGLETTNGALRFPEIGVGQLLRKPLNEVSFMDGSVINPAATKEHLCLVYGDFSQFVIADRIGSTIEIVQHLMGATYRPTGERGALLWFRTGSDCANIDAFRLLAVNTTA